MNHTAKLWRFARQHPADLAGALLSAIAATGILFLVPGWAATLVTTAIPSADASVLAMHLLRGVALCVVIVGASFSRDLFFMRLSARFAAEMREGMMARLLRRPLHPAPRGGHGELLARVSGDVVALHQALVRGFAVLVPHSVTSACLLLAMVAVSWRLTLGTVLLVVPMLWAVGVFGRRLHTAAQASYERAAELTGFMHESLRGAREVKTFGREGLLADRAGVLNARWLTGILDEERLAVLHPAAVTLAGVVGISGLVFLSVWLRRQGLVAADELVWFLVCLTLLVGPLQEAVRSIGSVTRFFALMDRCGDVLGGAMEEDPPGTPALPRLSGELTFDNIVFRYESTGFQLGPLTLDIGAGETVAIVGGSGGGKSTFLDLIPRLIEPASGEIQADGLPIARYRRASLRDQVGVVSQEPVLLPGTLLENLRFGKLDASDAEVFTAARLAHVEEFAHRLPAGYATLIGAGGSALSVGQQQRVALARALLKDPPILLLDEPTSALDAESERLLRDALRTCRAGRTTIVVTHRLGIARDADRVIVLDNGRVVGEGAHEMLLGTCDAYAALHLAAGEGIAAR